MEIKKSSSADLENKRILFFLAGLVISLTLFYFLINWKISDTTEHVNTEIPFFIENEFIQQGILKNAEIVEPIPEKEEEKTVYEGFNPTDKITENQDEPPLPADEIFPEESTEINSNNKEKIETLDEKTEEIPTAAEKMPQFPGGKIALARYLQSNIKYPEVAIKQHKQGRVWCSFIVNDDGTVSNITVEKGVYSFLDDEALRVLKAMPKWIAGEENGKKMCVKVYLPVVFTL
jgi:protein TonB